MLLERVLQLEGHPTVLTGKVPDVRVDLEVYMVCRDLIKSLSTLLTAPAVSPDAMGPQVDVDAVPCLELFPTLLTAVRPVCRVFEEHVQLHVTLSVELSRTLRTGIRGRETSPPPARPGVTGLVLQQSLVVCKVPTTVWADVDTALVLGLGVLRYQVPLVRLEDTASDPALELGPDLSPVDCSLVDIELLVGDKVHVALGTPVARLLSRQVSFSDVNISVFEREEGQVAADALDLGAGHQGRLSPAGATLDVPRQVGQVVPALTTNLLILIRSLFVIPVKVCL